MGKATQVPQLMGDSNRLRIAGVNALGPLEKQIMDYLWTHGVATVSDVHKAFREANHELAYTTIMSTMSRLADKGLLSVDKKHVTYVYMPATSEEEYIDNMIGRVMDALVDADPEAVLNHLAKRLGRTVMPKDSTFSAG